MKVREDADVGVIVGRFQVPDLHEAHVSLFEHVIETHARVLVFLGLSGAGQPTRENSLDFTARWQMIRAKYPDVEVHYIHDQGDDAAWSRRLDSEVARLLNPGQKVVLYGGRDSFVGRYHGVLRTCELEPEVWVSGTDIRKAASKKVKASRDFRLGVIWATHNRFPAVHTTVDVAIFGGDGRLLLGKKPGEPLWRFVGGFADPGSDTFEDDAIREVREETGLTVGTVEYLGSYKIDDWRYRDESDAIKTLFFAATVLDGTPSPDDDIAELKWFVTDDIMFDDVMPNHRPLLDDLLARR